MAKKTNGSGKARGRKSKAESMTGKKENEAEMRKAGELDLKPVMIDDDDFDLHFRATKSAKEMAEKYQSLYRSSLKNAKKVSEDLHDSIKVALAIEGKDPAELKRKLEIDGYVLRKTGCSIQLTLHDTLAGDEKELVAKRGFASGQRGETLNNQYPEGSTLATIFADAWLKGTTSNIKGMPADDDRPAGEGNNSEDADEGDDLGEFAGTDESDRRAMADALN